MRKFYLFVGLLLVISNSFGQRFVHNHYQIYRDERFSDIHYRMFWTGVLDDSQILMGIRSLNERTGDFHNFLAVIEKMNSRNWTITHIEGDSPVIHSEHRKILDDLSDLLRISSSIQTITPNHGFGRGIVEQESRQVSFNNELHRINYLSLLPNLPIRSIQHSTESLSLYTLYQSGSIEFENQSDFFKLVPTFKPESSNQRDISTIPTFRPRTLGSIEITLDSRWSWSKARPLRAEFSQTLGTVEAWIEVEQINPQTRIGMKLWNPNDLNSYFLANRPGIIFVETLDTSGFQGFNRIMFLGLNPGGDFKFYSYFVFLFDDKMYVLNFVVNGDLYQQNVHYFRSILDSVRLVDSL